MLPAIPAPIYSVPLMDFGPVPTQKTSGLPRQPIGDPPVRIVQLRLIQITSLTDAECPACKPDTKRFVPHGPIGHLVAFRLPPPFSKSPFQKVFLQALLKQQFFQMLVRARYCRSDHWRNKTCSSAFIYMISDASIPLYTARQL